MIFILPVALLLATPFAESADSQVVSTFRSFGVVRPIRRAAVREVFDAWIARDRSKFISTFVPRLLDGREIAAERFAIFDDTDVFGDPILGAPDSQATIEDIRTFGNSELVTVFVRWAKPIRDDYRWVPLAYLYNVSFSNPGSSDGDKIVKIELVASYTLATVNA